MLIVIRGQCAADKNETLSLITASIRHVKQKQMKINDKEEANKTLSFRADIKLLFATYKNKSLK
jgi:hypothetical protein